MTHPTRAYTLAELDMLPPSVVIEWMKKCSKSVFDLGVLAFELSHDNDPLTMPIRSYAAAVVERFSYMADFSSSRSKYLPKWDRVEYDGERLDFKYNGGGYLFPFPTNPFQGLTSPDGSQRTSCTREELEQWKRVGGGMSDSEKIADKLMKDFDGDKYGDRFCKKQKCDQCEGTDETGEPSGYGCSLQDAYITNRYNSILKRRLKKRREVV